MLLVNDNGKLPYYRRMYLLILHNDRFSIPQNEYKCEMQTQNTTQTCNNEMLYITQIDFMYSISLY